MKYLDYIFDGVNGTYYQQLTGEYEPVELANITNPDKIINIHKEYIEQGVSAIKTNSFAINSSLSTDLMYRDYLIKASIKNARHAVENKDISIFASIGPINCPNNHYEYLEIVKVFEEEGITNFLFETLVEYDSIKQSIRYIKEHIRDSVVIVSFACNQDGYTKLGYNYQALFEQACHDVDYVGLNCICGPNHMYELIKKIDTRKYNVCIMPNAGYLNKMHLDKQVVDNASYYSDMILKFVSLKVKIVGGCCGTTPLHMKEVVSKLALNNIVFKANEILPIKRVSQESKIKDILYSNNKLICAEVEPPTTSDSSQLLSSAFRLKAEGAHILTIVDSPLARTRADSLMIASKIKKEVGIEVLPHLTCRDKNQIAIKAGLIGANIEGVNNILTLSGDSIAPTERSHHQGVFCFNSMNLINYIACLNKDVFYDNPYLIAGALNINAHNFNAELERAQLKVINKVDYFISQSLFSKDAIKNIRHAKQILDVPIVVGLYPVASYKNAQFLNNEVSGISIPSSYIELLKNTDPTKYQEVSVNYVKDLIKEVFNDCDGFYIATPLRKTEYVCDIIKYIKELEVSYETKPRHM